MFGMILTPLINTFAVSCNANATFFGLVPWYHFLTLASTNVLDGAGHTVYTTCAITNFNTTGAKVLGAQSPFLLITLAILDDLVRVAGLVAVGFIIFGGIQYTTSQGSPDATKKAQQTIINALIGVVIAVLASGIVEFIGNKLGG